MAIGWLTVLQSVPWTEVISNAPQVAEGARKLWNAVGKKAPAPQPSDSPLPVALSPEAQAIATLETRVASLEAGIADLHGQMLASSELIQALAEQNTQLIQRVEANRVRMLWLTAVMALVVVAIMAIGLVVARTS